MGRVPFAASCLIVLGLLPLASAAYAAEMGDCGHPVATRSIPACSRLIDRGGVASEVLADYYLFRGTAHLLMAEPDKVIADLDQAIRLKPASAEVLVARGDAYRNLGNFERAFADYDEAIRIDPKHIFGHIAKAQAFITKGDGARAKELQEEMVRLGWHPEHIWHRAQLRAALADRKQLDQTFARLDAAINLNPRDAAAYVDRADHFMRLSERQFARVAADLAEAIRVDPTHVNAYYTRAQLYKRTGELDRAIEDLGQVLVHAVNDPHEMAKAFLDRSRIFRHRGDFDRHMADLDQAILNYEKAVEPLKQKHWDVLPMVLGLFDQRCGFLAERRLWDRALAACGQAIDRAKLATGQAIGRGKFAGISFRSLRVRGDVYFELGSYALAIADYDEIILFSNDPRGYYRRGLAHEKTGAREKAIADFRQARAMLMRTVESLFGTDLGAERAAVAEALRRLGVSD